MLIGFDRVITSELAIHGALPMALDSADPADIVIRRALPEPAPVAPEPLYAWNGDALVFAAPGVARYTLRPDAIDVATEPDADPETVEALLIATALPALAWWRGALVLHAAAVRMPGSHYAIAIAGPSGIGKSSVVAALLARGASLVADDSIAIDFRSDIPFASGLPGGYHLGTGARGARAFHAVAPDTSLRCCPLGAVFVLRQGDDAPAIMRLSPLAAVTGLLANQHRPRIPAMLRRQAAALDTCARLVRGLPVHEWCRRSAVPDLAPREWDDLARLAHF